MLSIVVRLIEMRVENWLLNLIMLLILIRFVFIDGGYKSFVRLDLKDIIKRRNGN